MTTSSRVRLLDVLPLGALVRALLTFVAVADGVLSLQLWRLQQNHHHHHKMAGDALLAVASLKLLGALVLAAAALYLATRPKRAFRRILMLLTVLAAVLSVAASQPTLLAIAVTDCLAAFLAASLWPEIGRRRSSRFGWFLLGSAVAATAWLFLLQKPDQRMGFLFALVLGLALAATVSALALLGRDSPLPATSVLPAAVALYRSSARAGVSPFALMRDKRHFWATDRQAFLPFACRSGSALALGPAIGEAGSAGRLEDEFLTESRRRGWRPAFYQVPEETAGRLARAVRIGIGSEALVDVGAFGLEGPAMAKLRHDVARARRQEISVRVLGRQELSSEMRSALRHLDEEAASPRRLGAMSFSVGRRDDPSAVERTFGLAFDRDGRLVAYVTWLWLPAAATMALDEVKRSSQAPPGTVDLLIFTCLENFKGSVARASLGLAPMTGARQAARLALFESFLRRVLGVSSLSPGLYSFKAKFNPTWERRYLVVERLLDLPAVLTATMLLHYPELTQRWRRLAWKLVSQPAGARNSTGA
jgi:lysylphosphatidylglycerol synthetase-like protein (DUF2156 family)